MSTNTPDLTQAPDPFELWAQTYHPLPNPFNKNTLFGGTLVDLYHLPNERNHITQALATNPLCVWTLTEEGGQLRIEQGHHIVNRLGYFITEEPAKERYEVHHLSDPPHSPDNSASNTSSTNTTSCAYISINVLLGEGYLDEAANFDPSHPTYVPSDNYEILIDGKHVGLITQDFINTSPKPTTLFRVLAEENMHDDILRETLCTVSTKDEDLAPTSEVTINHIKRTTVLHQEPNPNY